MEICELICYDFLTIKDVLEDTEFFVNEPAELGSLLKTRAFALTVTIMIL